MENFWGLEEMKNNGKTTHARMMDKGFTVYERVQQVS